MSKLETLQVTVISSLPVKFKFKYVLNLLEIYGTGALAEAGPPQRSESSGVQSRRGVTILQVFRRVPNLRTMSQQLQLKIQGVQARRPGPK